LSNPRFHEGAILSLWTARELLDGPVLVMDADVLCASAMIARLVESPNWNCFLLDAGVEVTGEEQMLLVRGERVLDIVRGGAPGYELAGESVGFLKLSAGAARVLRRLPAVRVAPGPPALAPAPTSSRPADDALRLVVGAGTVIDPALVRDLQARARPGQVLEVEADGARVRVAPGPLVARNGGARIGPGAGTLRRAGSAGLEQALLCALENPRDGYLDGLRRRLSRPLTRLLVRTPVTPNAVTMIGIALGVVGGLLLGVPGVAPVVAAIVLLEASGVLDCSDGELARLRFAESRFGHWLDVTGDTVVHVAVLAGIAQRVARAGSAPGWPLLAALLLGVLGAFAMISW